MFGQAVCDTSRSENSAEKVEEIMNRGFLRGNISSSTDVKNHDLFL